MANMIDYIVWRGDLTMEQADFCDIDGLILSELSYILWETMIWKDEDTALKDLLPRIPEGNISGSPVGEKDRELLCAAAQSKRFGDVKVSRYVREFDEDEEKQFAAVTFLLPDGTPFVSFRGTDDTLIGWKEDLSLAFSDPVPSQLRAKKYLKEILLSSPAAVLCGGHSKGANLALYAATSTEKDLQERIAAVYVNDGPGLPEEIFSGKGYEHIRARLHVFLPQKSIVGILLSHPEEYTVVQSSASGILQHDAFSWQVSGPHFEECGERKRNSIYIEAVVRSLLNDADEEQLRCFVDTIFSVLDAADATTVKEVLPKLIKNPKQVREAFRNIDPADRKTVAEVLNQLIGTALREGEKTISDHPKVQKIQQYQQTRKLKKIEKHPKRSEKSGRKLKKGLKIKKSRS